MENPKFLTIICHFKYCVTCIYYKVLKMITRFKRHIWMYQVHKPSDTVANNSCINSQHYDRLLPFVMNARFPQLQRLSGCNQDSHLISICKESAKDLRRAGAINSIPGHKFIMNREDWWCANSLFIDETCEDAGTQLVALVQRITVQCHAAVQTPHFWEV